MIYCYVSVLSDCTYTFLLGWNTISTAWGMGGEVLRGFCNPNFFLIFKKYFHMVITKVSNEKKPHYILPVWNMACSIFDSFCGIYHAGNTRFWDVRWSRTPSSEYIYIYIYIYIIYIYIYIYIYIHVIHMFKMRYENILISKKKRIQDAEPP